MTSRNENLIKNFVDADEVVKDGYELDIVDLSELCHAISASKGFWENARNKAEMIALIHSEASEMLEGVRKPELMSEKCPELTLEEEEWADLLIRVLDYGHGNGLRMGKAFIEKTLFNINRPYKHGKRF